LAERRASTMLDIESILKEGESDMVEFKIAPPRANEMADRICGFANSTSGGYLIIGVQDKSWEVVGVKNVSDTIDQILYATRLCHPQVHLNPSLPQTVLINDSQLVVAHIPPNDGTLYQSGGVCWIRKGTHTTPMVVSEIQRYLYHRGVLDWETQPVRRATLSNLNRDLIELYLKQRPSRSRGVFRPSTMEEILVNLECLMATSDETGKEALRPTNAGLLLFADNPQEFLLQSEVVCALFRDNSGLKRFSDRRVFQGPISDLIDQVGNWFDRNIAVPARVQGFNRIDEPEYPLEVLREATVNALVHRDYSLKGENVRIFFYSDRIEFRNPGLLMPGLNIEDLREGRAGSKLRNPVITGILRNLPGSYMDRMGSGIPFMLEEMRRLGRRPPEFREQGEFIVTFYRETSAQTEEIRTSLKQKETAAEGDSIVRGLQRQRQELALKYIHKNGYITNGQYRELVAVSDRTAYRDLEALVAQGTLRTTGQKRSRRYMV